MRKRRKERSVREGGSVEGGESGGVGEDDERGRTRRRGDVRWWKGVNFKVEV